VDSITTSATIPMDLAMPVHWIPIHTFLELKPTIWTPTQPDQESKPQVQLTGFLTTPVPMTPTPTCLETNMLDPIDHTIDIQ
jgi:hypothetical protein